MVLHKKFILQEIPEDRRRRVWASILEEKAILPISNKTAREAAEQYNAELPRDLSNAVRCGFLKTEVDRTVVLCEDCELEPESCGKPENSKKAHSLFFGFLALVQQESWETDDPDKFKLLQRNMINHFKGCDDCKKRFDDFDTFANWCSNEMFYNPEAVGIRAVSDFLQSSARGTPNYEDYLAMKRPQAVALMRRIEDSTITPDTEAEKPPPELVAKLNDIAFAECDRMQKEQTEEAMLDAELDAMCKETDCHESE